MSREQTPALAYALGSEVRREILRNMARRRPGEVLCARDLSEILGRNLEVTSYHLQRLHECGAVAPVATPDGDPIRVLYVLDIDDPRVLAALGLEEHGTGSDDTEGSASA